MVDSQHIAAETTGRFVADGRPLAVIAPSMDASSLTPISNDYGFEEAIARQVVGLRSTGDCLVAISTSGNSHNVLRGVEVARRRGLHIIGLLGREGGKLRPLSDVAMVVPSWTPARIQELTF